MYVFHNNSVIWILFKIVCNKTRKVYSMSLYPLNPSIECHSD